MSDTAVSTGSSLLYGVRRKAVSDLVGRLSPAAVEFVRQDLIQSVGNALRMQQRQARAELRSIAVLLRHQVEVAELSEIVATEASVSQTGWGDW
jgi:hypothetical protein